MAIPTLFGATFPANKTLAAAQVIVDANLDVAVSPNGAQQLAYALGGTGVNVLSNNMPLYWAYTGPFVASSKIIGELVDSGVRISTGFVAILLPQLETPIANQSLNAATPVQVQTVMQSVIAGFFATLLA